HACERLCVGALLFAPLLGNARRLARRARRVRDGDEGAVQRPLRAYAVERLLLRPERRRQPRDVRSARASGEQALLAPSEQRLRALFEPRLVEAEAREERSLIEPPEPRGQDVV